MAITSISAELLAQSANAKKKQQESTSPFASYLQAENADTAVSQGAKEASVVSATARSESKSGREQQLDAKGNSLWAEDQVNESDADIEEFLAFAKMTPAEKIRYLMLKEMGLTEEELAALPPDERRKIEQKIEDAIKRKVEEATGVPASPSITLADAF